MNKEILKKIILSLIISLSGLMVSAQPGTYAEINAQQADSLIKANKKNPKFVILDIRTPAEYDPKHLEGAINRNYYETFDQKLDSLDKQKLYLLHCQSGARSAGAFAKMKAKNFGEVYNLKGGIKEWLNAGLPFTSGFASLLMFASDTIFEEKQIVIEKIDTIKLKITNRANDTLKVFSVSDISNPEYTTDFDKDTILLGASDYFFNIYYAPLDETQDSLIFTITSNGGTKKVKIYHKSILSSTCECLESETTMIYPNPAYDYLYINSENVNNREYFILDINARIVKRHIIDNSGKNQRIEINDLKPGIYFLKEKSANANSFKFIKY